MATLANLHVLVGANVSGLTRGLRSAEKSTRKFSGKASREMKNFGRSAGNAVRSVVNLRSAIGVLAGSAGIGAVVKVTLDAARETSAYADALKMSSRELQAWQHASSSVNVNADKMGDIFKDVSEKIGDAFANKGGEAVEVLERLNLSASEMARLSPDQQMLRIAGALEQVGTQSERVQIMESLASDASLLLPLLEDNAAGLRKLRDDAIKTGIALDEVDMFKLQAANDAMVRAKGAFVGVSRVLTVELAPVIEAVANHFADATADAGGFREEVLAGTESIAVGVGYLGNTFRGLHVVWKGLEVAFAGIAEGIWNTFDMLIGGIDAAMTKLPFVGDRFGSVDDRLSSIMSNATARTRELQAEFDKLIMEPMPTQNVETFFTSIRKTAEEAALAVAKSRKGMGAEVAGVSPTAGGEGEDTKLQDNLRRLQESMLAENEALALNLEEQQWIAEEAFQNGFIRDSERNAILEQLESQHQEKMKDIRYKGLSDSEKMFQAFKAGEYDIVAKTGVAMLGAVIGTNNKIFKATQKFALAQTVISGAQSAAESLAKNGGVPWGLPAMFTSLAKTGALRAVISGTGIGSTGGGGVGGGVSAPPAPTPSAQPDPRDMQREDRPPTIVTINMGDGWSGDKGTIRGMIDQINEAHEDGYKLRLA